MTVISSEGRLSWSVGSKIFLKKNIISHTWVSTLLILLRQGLSQMLGFLPNSSFKTQRWQILAPNPFIAIHKNRKTTGPKVENEIPNIVYMYSVFFTCWKLGPRWTIYSCHTHILLLLPKSQLNSITLILICITLTLVPLLGNHFSFHFITLHCKRNIMSCHRAVTYTYSKDST